MSRFKIKLKLQGLELEVEGSRDDIPIITQAVSQQFAGLLLPANDIVVGETPSTNHESEKPKLELALPAKTNTAKRVRKPKSLSNTDQDAAKAVSWKHNPEKWGTPKQGWNTAKKSIWLLHVVAQETDVKEMTTAQIVVTFNTHFKQAKTITPSNVTRDLGRLKVKTGTAPVAEDTAKSPTTWYLTQTGIKQAQASVYEALEQGQD